MTEGERLDLWDLLPADPVIWADDDELAHFGHANLRWWLDTLGHPKAHRGCCKACGCCTTCMAGAFHQAVVTTMLRELDRIGALVKPETPTHGAHDPAPAPTPVSTATGQDKVYEIADEDVSAATGAHCGAGEAQEG